VRAAAAVFARKGFHRAKLDDITEAAGVTRGALYWYYRTKEAFLIAVLGKFLPRTVYVATTSDCSIATFLRNSKKGRHAYEPIYHHELAAVRRGRAIL